PPPPVYPTSAEVNCRLAHPEILDEYYRKLAAWNDLSKPMPALPGPEAYVCAPGWTPAGFVPTQPPAPVLPPPAVSPNDSYSTSNGVKTSNQIQADLLGVGNAGPFDVPSLLAAYQHTTNSPVRPI